ncbi:MAG: CBS domain-containing protein [Acidimicrobiia bacterium]|nr:CBS domain-containing protein [Acidimicrobiia bacterium]
MKLRDLIEGPMETVSPTTSLYDCASAMVTSGVGSMGIVTDGDFIGIITERDMLDAAAMRVDFEQAVVGNHMTRHPDVFSPSVEVEQVAEWLLETGYRHVPVVSDDIIAILSIRDILAAVVDPGRVQVLMSGGDR